VTHPSQAEILGWLRDGNAETQVTGLRCVKKSAIAIEAFWSEFPRLLREPNADVRWLTAELLLGATCAKDITAFVPHLEPLFDDLEKPSWLKRGSAYVFTVGGTALKAVATCYMQQCRSDLLRALIAKGGEPGGVALQALYSAKEAGQIVPLLPVVVEALTWPDQKLRVTAARVLAHYHWLEQRWDQAAELLRSDDESVRLGVISELDDLAESGRTVEPLLPELLSVLTKRDRRFKASREQAAGVLVWLVLEKQPPGAANLDIPKSFILNDVDIMKIPEIRTALKALKSAAR
jgi:hypothetical protein